MQLARDAHRYRVQARIQNVDLRIGDRMTDRHAGQFALRVATPVGDVDRSLRRTVQVMQRHMTPLVQEALLQFPRQRLAAAHHLAQRCALLHRRRVRKHFQHRRNEVRRRDALLRDQLRQVCHILMAARFRQHQPRAFHQRPEELPHRDVETERRFLQHAVLRRQLVSLLHPAQTVNDTRVVDGCAFRTAGRTGGVDHVGQVARRRQIGRIGGVACVQRGRVGVQQEYRRFAGWQHRQQALLRQQHRRRRILQHVGQAVGRVGWVQRHVRAAGFQYAHQAYHHLQRALRAYAHQHVRAYTQRAQMMRQAVRPRIQFGIGQLLIFVHQRHLMRRRQDLALKQLVQRSIEQGCVGRVVPLHQQLVAFRCRQHVDGANRAVRRGFQRRHELLDGGVHVLAYALCRHACADLRRQRKVVAQIVDRERDRIIGALFAAEHSNALPCRVARLLRHAMAVVEQRREQRHRRLHAAATLRQRQRRVLVTEQLRQHVVRGAHRLRHALFAQLETHRQRVDEHPQYARRIFTAGHTAQQHRAEHHIVAARHLGQHLRPCQMHDARSAHAQLACLLAQTTRQIAIDHPVRLDDARAIALHVEQAEWGGRFIHVGQHRAEVGLVLGLAHAQTGLGNEITERQRRWQFVGAALQQHAHFRDQHVERAVIDRQVVRQDLQQPAAIGLVLCGKRAHQRRLAHVQSVMARMIALRQVLCDVGRVVQVDLLGHQMRLAPDHLHRFVQAIPMHGRTQDIVARHDLVQGRDKAVKPLAAVELHQARQQVGVALLAHHVMEQDTFLQRRQWIDILDVGGAARNRRDHACDLLLVQLHQRHHLRRDRRATVHDAVGRHHDVVVFTTRRSGQCRDGRRGEQGPHVDIQAGAAHALHQRDRQQRVAAQREEVVVHAHFVQIEHAGPDIGHGLFGRRARRHVAFFAACHIRRWQGLAVHFAVRRQWQLVQHHEVRRHHVFRQRCQQGGAQSGGIRQLLAIVRDQIRDQPLVARHVLAGQHQCVAHRLQRCQYSLDFAKLDAEPTQFDLVVDTTEVLDVTVFQIARQVARFVHAAARSAERIRHEFVRRQVGSVQVAARQAGTGNMQLAGHAHRHRIEGGIQQIDLRITDRPAKHRYLAGVRDGAHGRVHGRLGRAVDVEAALCRRLLQLFPQLLRDGFAADEQTGRQCVRTGRLQQ
ncbi:hypothetical protein DUGA2_64130 [Duganella sp. HH101]|nr:hypothetical protein DUGA2_64130 [Duganella sp. HH101]